MPENGFKHFQGAYHCSTETQCTEVKFQFHLAVRNAAVFTSRATALSALSTLPCLALWDTWSTGGAREYQFPFAGRESSLVASAGAWESGTVNSLPS